LGLRLDFGRHRGARAGREVPPLAARLQPFELLPTPAQALARVGVRVTVTVTVTVRVTLTLTSPDLVDLLGRDDEAGVVGDVGDEHEDVAPAGVGVWVRIRVRFRVRVRG